MTSPSHFSAPFLLCAILLLKGPYGTEITHATGFETTGTTTVTSNRPDLLVGKTRNGKYKGFQIFNRSGRKQKVTQRTTGESVTTYFRIETGVGKSKYELSASQGDSRFSAKYFLIKPGSRKNITAALARGDYRLTISATRGKLLCQKVKPGRDLAGRKATSTYRITDKLENFSSIDTAVSVIRKDR